MNYRVYQWIYVNRKEYFAEFVVTFNSKVILAIQFDGNLADCDGFSNFDKIGEYEFNTYWKIIE